MKPLLQVAPPVARNEIAVELSTENGIPLSLKLRAAYEFCLWVGSQFMAQFPDSNDFVVTAECSRKTIG